MYFHCFRPLYGVLFIYSIQDIKELVRSDSFSSPSRSSSLSTMICTHEPITLGQFSSPLRGSYLSATQEMLEKRLNHKSSSPLRGFYLSTLRLGVSECLNNIKMVFVPSTGFFFIYSNYKPYRRTDESGFVPSTVFFFIYSYHGQSWKSSRNIWFSSPLRGSFLSTRK